MVRRSTIIRGSATINSNKLNGAHSRSGKTWLVPLCELSRQWPLIQPVDVQQALGKEPGAVDLHEGVGVSERGDHQASLSTLDSDVMCEAVSFACCAVVLQRKECALSNEMRCGVVLVQVGEDRSELISRVQLL